MITGDFETISNAINISCSYIVHSQNLPSSTQSQPSELATVLRTASLDLVVLLRVCEGEVLVGTLFWPRLCLGFEGSLDVACAAWRRFDVRRGFAVALFFRTTLFAFFLGISKPYLTTDGLGRWRTRPSLARRDLSAEACEARFERSGECRGVRCCLGWQKLPVRCQKICFCFPYSNRIDSNHVDFHSSQFNLI